MDTGAAHQNTVQLWNAVSGLDEAKVATLLPTMTTTWLAATCQGRFTVLYLPLLRLWNTRTDEPCAYAIMQQLIRAGVPLRAPPNAVQLDADKFPRICCWIETTLRHHNCTGSFLHDVCALTEWQYDSQLLFLLQAIEQHTTQDLTECVREDTARPQSTALSSLCHHFLNNVDSSTSRLLALRQSAHFLIVSGLDPRMTDMPWLADKPQETNPHNPQVGDILDVKDIKDVWAPAEVTLTKQDECLVHYLGWSRQWDEWISLSSPRLGRLGSHWRNMESAWYICSALLGKTSLYERTRVAVMDGSLTTSTTAADVMSILDDGIQALKDKQRQLLHQLSLTQMPRGVACVVLDYLFGFRNKLD